MEVKLRNTVVKITLTILAATSLVGLLAWMALRPINQKNGFNRQFLATNLELLQVTKKDESVNGIAGTSGWQFYFRTNSPARLWITDSNLQKGHLIKLGVPVHPRIASAFYCEVDSPLVHIMAGNGPAIIQAPLSGGQARIMRFPSGLFTRAARVSTSTYVFRGFDTAGGNEGQVFLKGNPVTAVITRNEGIAPSKTDVVGISTDGHLNYDASTSRLLYVSFYSNRFFCLDSNLQLIYAGHTIDTVSRPHIETGKAGNTITGSSPVRVINSRSKVSGGCLYVVSKLQADNEEAVQRNHQTTVDVYDEMTGSYLGSFYIPFYKRERLTDFSIAGNRLLILYKNYAALYRLPTAVH